MTLRISRIALVVLALAVMLGVGATAARAQEDEPVYVSHGDEDWEEEGRWAFGLGFGLVNLNEEALNDDVENYLMASFRYRVGGRSGGWTGKRIRGYIEPELGYWEKSEGRASASDLLLGANIIGVIPMDAIDFFVGGGLGIHFLDTDLAALGQGSGLSESDEALGANAQFGVDVRVSRSTSLFAVGRFDIVDSGSESLETKAYVGVRFTKK